MTAESTIHLKKALPANEPAKQAPVSYLILHRSPVFIVLPLLAIESVYFITGLFLLGLRSLPLIESIVLSPLIVILILAIGFVLKLIATLLVAMVWLNDFYEIRSNEIIHHQGVLQKRRDTMSTAEVRSFSCEQDLVGQLLHYGSVVLYNPALEREIRIDGISHPNRCQQLIAQFLPKIEQPPAFVHTGGITTG